MSNDLLLLGQDLSKIEDVKCQLGKLYQMKDLGPADMPRASDGADPQCKPYEALTV